MGEPSCTTPPLRGSVGAAQHLIEIGSDINAQDRQGFTALHFAAQGFQLDVARLLLAAGASTTVQNIHGNTALWTATFNSRGRGELIIELLARGADPDSLNDSGASPRTLAATIDNYEVAQFFESGDSAQLRAACVVVEPSTLAVSWPRIRGSISDLPDGSPAGTEYGRMTRQRVGKGASCTIPKARSWLVFSITGSTCASRGRHSARHQVLLAATSLPGRSPSSRRCALLASITRL
jgi:uncharacterized protein